MALSFSAVEQALLAWVGETVPCILAKQKGPQPALPYATLTVSGPHQTAPLPIIVQTYDAAQPAGSEIELRAVFQDELTASLQAFTASAAGDASAKALLAQARSRLGLPSVMDALRAAGLALVEVGDTQDVSALLETSFQGRAAMDLRFLVTDEAAERTGYVAKVSVTGTTT